MEQQPEEVSNKTILLLVVLTLTVSFIGAWVNIYTATTTAQPAEARTNTGEVNFFITEQKQPEMDRATGLVSLEIV